ncbi:MAG: hypothetical protein ABSC32_22310 [Steroidobacteraceae bacterium]|jgi:hypothetical protein
MSQLTNDIKGALKSRRFKEVTAMVLCVASAVRGWYDLKHGATFGIEMATMGLVWAFAYGWLTGRRLPLRLRSARLIGHVEGAGEAARRPRRHDTPLEAVLSWGLWAFFLALVLWIASGA